MKPLSDALRAKKILIVDDAQSMRSLLAAVLREFGLSRVDEAGDGVQALRKLQRSRYDLVLCDWEMPAMSGIELLDQVRKDDAIAQVPFIMVTSQATADRVQEAIAVGTSDYIVKPINTDTVISKVTKLLSAAGDD